LGQKDQSKHIWLVFPSKLSQQFHRVHVRWLQRALRRVFIDLQSDLPSIESRLRFFMSFLTLFIKPLAYISVPVIILRTIASASPVGRYYAQLTIYLGTLAVVSTWGVFVAVGMTLIGRRHDVNYVVARSFYAIASRVLDIQVEVEGEEHLQTCPTVMVGNHQSMLDILYLGRYVSKLTSGVTDLIHILFRMAFVGCSLGKRPLWLRRSSNGRLWVPGCSCQVLCS
jgi:hypothetical protein